MVLLDGWRILRPVEAGSAGALGAERAGLELDATSACVAAAHWLRAAADVVAEISGIAATNVVMAADNIEALPQATPMAVLEPIDMDMSPTAAVTGLICDVSAR